MKSILRKILPDRILLHLSAYDHYYNGEVELRLLPHLCDTHKISVDVGTNIGSYTYFMRKYSSHVHAYEPNPILTGQLKRLFRDVTVHAAAASDVTGQLVLCVPIHRGRIEHELSSVCEDASGDYQYHEYIVDAKPIDDERFEDVGFLIIDAERHELLVLNGSMRTIKDSRPLVMSEVSPLLYSHDLPDTFDFILKHDYKAFFRFENRYISFEYYCPKIHANKDQYPFRFMSPNVIVASEERVPDVLIG